MGSIVSAKALEGMGIPQAQWDTAETAAPPTTAAAAASSPPRNAPLQGARAPVAQFGRRQGTPRENVHSGLSPTQPAKDDAILNTLAKPSEGSGEGRQAQAYSGIAQQHRFPQRERVVHGHVLRLGTPLQHVMRTRTLACL